MIDCEVCLNNGDVTDPAPASSFGDRDVLLAASLGDMLLRNPDFNPLIEETVTIRQLKKLPPQMPALG